MCIAANSQFVPLVDTATGVQRAARVHRHPALHPFPAPHVGATGGPTLDRGVAGQDPDPGPGLGHHPDPDHHPRVFTVASGEMFTGQLMFEFSM